MIETKKQKPITQQEYARIAIEQGKKQTMALQAIEATMLVYLIFLVMESAIIIFTTILR